MMQSMAALAVIGIFWIAIGYSLAFGAPLIKVDLFGVKDASLIGWNWDLVFLKGILYDAKLPNNNIPVYAHVLFQGMFAIITPALISGAIAERIRFWPFCIYMLLWVALVRSECPRGKARQGRDRLIGKDGCSRFRWWDCGPYRCGLCRPCLLLRTWEAGGLPEDGGPPQ
jgi:hypothetical protein